ncbi:hypothetical protein AC1031_018911 [Aphanomyces cochlioides]|nr:hypothetical protein AC1031_018911 [Aphanomyces cochlioides]
MDNCAADGRVIRALGESLAGSNRLLVVASGMVTKPSDDRTPDESVGVIPGSHPRGESEVATEAVASTGLRVVILRLPPSVHGEGDKAFIPLLMSTAREKGVAAYVGNGENRWSAVHRLDAAVLCRLIVESATESGRVHAIADEGVSFREIAETIGKRLNVPVVSKTPEEADGHFGWFGAFVAMDFARTSEWTREKYGWKPVQPSLLQDMDSGAYVQQLYEVVFLHSIPHNESVC